MSRKVSAGFAFLAVALILALAFREQIAGIVPTRELSAAGYYRRGVDSFKEGALDESILALQRAIQTTPSKPESHYYLGMALESIGRPAEAAEEYKKSISLNPRLAGPRFNLAMIYRSQGKEAAAVAQLNEAVNVSPDFAGAHYALGQIYASRERRDSAMAEFRMVLEINPGHQEAREQLAALEKKAP